jgi:hypothetical protein
LGGFSNGGLFKSYGG